LPNESAIHSGPLSLLRRLDAALDVFSQLTEYDVRANHTT
jgi:hypothetical protein